MEPPVVAELSEDTQSAPAAEETRRAPPDPDTLAHRIQVLLAAASVPFSASSSGGPGTEERSKEHSEPLTHTNAAPKSDAVTGAPLPPSPPAALTSDPELISLLSSPDVMNGQESDGKNGGVQGKGRSVWEALEKLTARVPWMTSGSALGAADGGDKADNGKGKAIELGNMGGKGMVVEGQNEQEENVLDDDDSGVMVYGPLFPSSDPAAASEVELAKSELVPVNQAESHTHAADGHTKPSTSAPSTPWPDKVDLIKGKLEGMWPFSKSVSTQTHPDQEGQTLSTSRVHFQPVKSEHRTRRVWLPSRDKISVQVMWWGYRVYVTHLWVVV